MGLLGWQDYGLSWRAFVLAAQADAQERAAIVEFDGRQSREEAERWANIELEGALMRWTHLRSLRMNRTKDRVALHDGTGWLLKFGQFVDEAFLEPLGTIEGLRIKDALSIA